MASATACVTPTHRHTDPRGLAPSVRHLSHGNCLPTNPVTKAAGRSNQLDGSSTRSVSPGIGAKRPAAQSALAASMRSSVEATKFHQM